MRQIEWTAMGCTMLALIDRDDQTAGEALEQAPGWFAGWEQQLSRFRAGSELSQLNAAAGRAVPVSRVLWDVLRCAIHAAQQSGGLVTPTVLGALEGAGYDRSFDGVWDQASSPSDSGHDRLPGDWIGIRLNPRTRTVRVPSGIRLDLGGVAKGWAAQTAARRLGQLGPALVDAGGDIAVSGPRADGSPWLIAVADPRGGEDPLELIEIARGGVATSGRDYRRWRQGAAWRHHIIDPRTGRPAETDVLSATVVAPSVLEAEMAAKVALIRGSAAGLAWIEARPQLAALLVGEDGTIVRSARFERVRAVETDMLGEDHEAARDPTTRHA